METATFCYLDVLDESGNVFDRKPVFSKAVIGRTAPGASPDVVVPPGHKSVSRNHATLDPRDGKLFLTDHSAYGTMVNGQPLKRRTVQVDDGDEVVFGLAEDGWRVRLRLTSPDATTRRVDPLELLTVTSVPREVRLGKLVVEEKLGDVAFRFLKYLAEHKGRWYPTAHLIEVLYPDPDKSPVDPNAALAHAKRQVNDTLSQHLGGTEPVESQPFRGYRLRARLERP